MARSRNIKPGFFTNEYLAELHPLSRLLFAGLWCMADKDGRLEYRPKRIKAAVLPFDDVNIESCLAQLCVKHDPSMDQPFIYVYEIDGKRYIQVAKWSSHQSPHHKEVDSAIPPMDVSQLVDMSELLKHDPSMSQAWPKHGPSITPLVPLIPDSLNLVTDSLNRIPDTLDTVLDTAPPSRPRSPAFEPPSIESVAAYCIERAKGVDPQQWYDHYTSNGWLVGKNKMKDWKAAVRTWEKNKFNGNGSHNADPLGTYALLEQRRRERENEPDEE